jgi:hypothetical protein
VHPVPLAAVLVLVINDHLLKGAGVLPGWATGKISDVAGLFFFPLLLDALARLALRRSLGGAAILATAIGFAAVKLSPPVNAVVSATWGPMVMDPTDLLALPVLALTWRWMRRERAGADGGSRVLRSVALIATSLATAATSAPRKAQSPVADDPLNFRITSCNVVGRHIDARIEASSERPIEIVIDDINVVVSPPPDGAVRGRGEAEPRELRLEPGQSTSFVARLEMTVALEPTVEASVELSYRRASLPNSYPTQRTVHARCVSTAVMDIAR